MSDESASIPQAVGLARGAEGADVEKLHEYLRRFGYLALPDAGEMTGVRTAAPAAEPEPGRFDEATVKALRTFQRFHGLPPTGVLDEATIAQIGMPRCGFPDVGDAAGVSSFAAQGNR